jgi:hypothetical protein
MSDIGINLVFEDSLGESVLIRLLAHSRRDYLVGYRYNAGGFGWIKKRIDGFNHAAKGMPYLILTDLDRHECPPLLIDQWLTATKHPNLLFRIAVREVEAWLLACRELFATFLGVPSDRIPGDVEAIPNPKEFVVNLARRSRKKKVRVDIAPAPASTARVGPDYNGRLAYFVENLWDPAVAEENCPSLRKTIETLRTFRPVS